MKHAETYGIDDELPLRYRFSGSVLYLLQYAFPRSALIERARKAAVSGAGAALSAKLRAQGRTKGRVIGVERRRDLGEHEFVREYLNRNLPVILEGAAKDWGCSRKWSLEFFKREFGDKKYEIVETEGLVERDLDTSKGMNRVIVTESVTANELVDGIRRGSKQYLRFSPLMETEPQLARDLDTGWLKKMRRTFFGVGYSTFVGPAGRVTPLHSDDTAFFYVVADGEKKWTLYSASSSLLINPRRAGRPYVFTNVNIKNPDPSEYPGFELLSRYECVVKKGDVLFVPSWMWHEVESLTDTWSLRYGFASLRTFFRHPTFVLARMFFCQPSFFKVLFQILIAKTKANTTLITPKFYTD